MSLLSYHEKAGATTWFHSYAFLVHDDELLELSGLVMSLGLGPVVDGVICDGVLLGSFGWTGGVGVVVVGGGDDAGL
jgi:hypothetical protein